MSYTEKKKPWVGVRRLIDWKISLKLRSFGSNLLTGTIDRALGSLKLN